MMMPRWNDSYLLGKTSIDEQHKGLVECASNVVGARTRDVQVRYVHDLQELTAAHFAHEQALMRALDYSEMEEHVHEHQLLLSELHAVAKALATGSLSQEELSSFFSEWLIVHCIGSDARLAAEIRALEYWSCDVE
jgi:hemerythrin-like metal-binding protein